MIRYFIADRNTLPESVAGVDWIQVRDKELPARELAALVRRALTLGVAKVIVNHRVDVALALGVAGAHLPSNSPPPSMWRPIVPAGFLLGVSCHTVDEVRLAAGEGADYVVFGPVFPPLSKSSPLPPRGLGGLKEAARVGIPVFALGGITEATAPSCIAAGASGIAGISMFQAHGESKDLC